MRKTIKNGFTIVELVIVIAVIAILAAVLIPTFAGIVNQANQSSDTQLVRNLNTALASDGRKHETMADALASAAKYGYDVSKINASATDMEIHWDSVNDLFCYYDKENNDHTYIPDYEPAKTVKDYQFWTVSSTVSDKFSVYYTGSEKTITTSKGFDAGTSTGIESLTYANEGDAQNVVLRTNSYRTVLTVDAPADVVNHYDVAGKVNVISTDMASYHENGTVAFLEVAGGHIVLESSADVTAIHFTATGDAFKNADEKTISVDLSKVDDDKKPGLSRDTVEVAAGSKTFVAEITGAVGGFLWVDDSAEIVVTTDAAGSVTDADAEIAVGDSKDEVLAELDAFIQEKIEEEDAALNGDCNHEFEFKNYIGTDKPECLVETDALYECTLCKATEVRTVVEDHDLIGVYCNKCKHPVAFVDEISDYTPDAETKQMMTLYDLFSLGYNGDVYLDIAYSFKAYPNNDSSVVDDEITYRFDEEKGEYVLDENGDVTALDLFNMYAGWYCDYFVSFDADVDALTCGLGGYYESIDMAVAFLAPPVLDGQIPGNMEIPLLGSVISGGSSDWTYAQVIEAVGEFKCGFFNLSEDNVGKTFTVKLRMTNPEKPEDIIDVVVTNYVIDKPSEANLELDWVKTLLNDING